VVEEEKEEDKCLLNITDTMFHKIGMYKKQAFIALRVI
jgi:hypothetical protein